MRRLCSVVAAASVTAALFSAGVADASVSAHGPGPVRQAVARIAWGRCTDPLLVADHA
jgi:hypothetical protein